MKMTPRIKKAQLTPRKGLLLYFLITTQGRMLPCLFVLYLIDKCPVYDLPERPWPPSPFSPARTEPCAVQFLPSESPCCWRSQDTPWKQWELAHPYQGGRYDPVYTNQLTDETSEPLCPLCHDVNFPDLPMFLSVLKCHLEWCWLGFWIFRSIIILRGDLHFNQVI